MISILLPAYKSDQLLKKVFIPSLVNCSVDCEVILYNNGGNNLEENALDKDFSFYTKGHKARIDWIPIGDGENIGLNKALNECAKIATGNYFYLPHSDIYLLPGWDLALLDACKNLAPMSFLFCSRSIEPTKGHTDYHIIKNYGKEAHEFQEEQLLKDFEDYKDNTIVVGARMPFFMHKDLWKRMEGVDPNYFSYCTDDDLIQEAYDKGVRRFWMIYKSLAYHLQGRSNSQQTVDKDSNRPYDRFISKWKNKYPDVCHPGQYHPSIIPFYIKIR